METERIAMSQRERDRLRVLHEVKQKHLTQVEAAQRLKLTDRHVRRMLPGLRNAGIGDRSPPARPSIESQVGGGCGAEDPGASSRQRYADFGPTLASEHLAQDGLR